MELRTSRPEGTTLIIYFEFLHSTKKRDYLTFVLGFCYVFDCSFPGYWPFSHFFGESQIWPEIRDTYGKRFDKGIWFNDRCYKGNVSFFSGAAAVWMEN